MINDNMSLEDLTKHFTDIMDNVDGKYTKIQYRTFTDDWNSLSVSVRQELADYLKDLPGRTKKDKNLLKNFTNILRKQAVDDFYANERELIKRGQGTYNWTKDEQKLILKGETPYTAWGEVYEGQHMYSVEVYPEFAGDWHNIQALTFCDHRKEAHNGNTRLNQTHGYYD